MARDGASWQISRCSLVLFWLLGNIKRGNNPTYYRSPSQYFSILLDQVETSRAAGSQLRFAKFQLQRATSVHAYVQVNFTR